MADPCAPGTDAPAAHQSAAGSSSFGPATAGNLKPRAGSPRRASASSAMLQLAAAAFLSFVCVVFLEEGSYLPKSLVRARRSIFGSRADVAGAEAAGAQLRFCVFTAW